MDDPSSDPARQTLEAGWGRRITVDIPSSVIALGLDVGETAVIAAALERNCTVVLDDGRARAKARSSGLSVIGTLGVILLAKRESRLACIADVLNDLRDAGLYLDDATIRTVLIAVGEVPFRDTR